MSATPSRQVVQSADQMSEQVFRHLQRIEKISRARDAQKIALFDLDNTLLVGDIGEAVFVRLVLQGDLPLTRWREYLGMLKHDTCMAYKFAVTSLAGLPLKNLVKTTIELLHDDAQTIELKSGTIPIPRPHPVMKLFVEDLQSLGYRLYLISASNQISAQIVGSQLFGIPESNIFGARVKLHEEELTGELLEPLPIGDGKVEVYRARVGKTDPLIVAADDPIDMAMMSLADPMGFRLWVQDDSILYEPGTDYGPAHGELTTRNIVR